MTNMFNLTPNPNYPAPLVSPKLVSNIELPSFVKITVPPFPDMKEGEGIMVSVGRVTLDRHNVTHEELNNSIIFKITNTNQIKVIFEDIKDGNHVETSYFLTDRASNNNLSLPANIVVRNIARTLEPINTTEVLSTYRTSAGLAIPIPNYTGFSIGDIITFYYETDDGDYDGFYDKTIVLYEKNNTDVNLDGNQITFIVNTTELIKSHNKQINVWYQVDRTASNEVLLSKVSSIEIHRIGILPAPDIVSIHEDQFTNGKTIFDFSDTVTLRIPAYETAKIGDQITTSVAIMKYSTDTKNIVYAVGQTDTHHLNPLSCSNITITEKNIGKDILAPTVKLQNLTSDSNEPNIVRYLIAHYYIKVDDNLPIFSDVKFIRTLL